MTRPTWTALTLLALAGGAEGQPLVCMPWEAVKRTFADQYGEVPVGGGIVNATAIVQVLASPDGKTFTILLVGVNGMACSIAAGKDWQVQEPVKGDPS